MSRKIILVPLRTPVFGTGMRFEPRHHYRLSIFIVFLRHSRLVQGQYLVAAYGPELVTLLCYLALLHKLKLNVTRHQFTCAKHELPRHALY
jgi:hypothetical protein